MFGEAVAVAAAIGALNEQLAQVDGNRWGFASRPLSIGDITWILPPATHCAYCGFLVPRGTTGCETCGAPAP
jgi:hypothetical protein